MLWNFIFMHEIFMPRYFHAWNLSYVLYYWTLLLVFCKGERRTPVGGRMRFLIPGEQQLDVVFVKLHHQRSVIVLPYKASRRNHLSYPRDVWRMIVCETVPNCTMQFYSIFSATRILAIASEDARKSIHKRIAIPCNLRSTKTMCHWTQEG